MASQSRKDKLALQAYKTLLETIRSGASVNPNETDEDKIRIIKRFKKDIRFLADTIFSHYCTSACADFQIDFSEKVKRNPTLKGFAEWPRGHAKSIWVDIIIPFWLHICGEPVYLVLIGNNYDKGKQLLSDIQAEFEANPMIIHYFGEQKKIGSWEDGFFQTTSGFIGQALGMGQSVRGLRVRSLRPTICVLDDIETKDLVKNPKRQMEVVQWIERDLIGTMDGKYRRLLYACNRFAPVMIQSLLQSRHPKWHIHHIKGYDPVTYKPTWDAKYHDTYFKELEQEIGVLACKAEYNNEPHIEGKIFMPEQIQYTKLPRIDHFELIVGHWDVAYAGTPTADFNAVRLWGLYKRNFYLIDCYVKQSKMDGAIHWMCDKQLELEARSSSVYIQWQYEAQFWNDEVERTISEVKEQYPIHLNLIQVERPRTKKYDRILSTQVYYQNGRIYYNEALKAHNDTQEGVAQLLGIEPGYKSHDDSPDADEAALKRLSEEIVINNAGAPSYGERYSNKSY